MEKVKFEFNDLMNKFKNGDLKISDIEVIKNICGYFKELDGDKGELKFYQATLLVYKAYFHLKKDRSTMVRYLLNNNFLHGVFKLIERKQKNSLDCNFKNEDSLLLNMFYILLVNYTYDNEKFCQAVYKIGIGFILNNLEDANLLSNWKEIPEKRQIIYDSVSIIYHTLIFGNLENEAAKYKGKENVLMSFMTDKESVNEINCTGLDLMAGVSMCLINGGDYRNKGSIVIEIVNKFIKNIEELGKREYEYFSDKELTQSLDLMNKYENLGKIIVNHNMTKYLRKLSTSDEWDIFLSYSHANNDVVDGIYECLVNEGIKVWRDKEEMAKQTRASNAMIEGIKKSKLFLAALSTPYEESENCMKEFNFAIVTHKKPYLIVKVEENYKCCDYIQFNITDTLYVKYKRNDEEGFIKEIMAKVENM